MVKEKCKESYDIRGPLGPDLFGPFLIPKKGPNRSDPNGPFCKISLDINYLLLTFYPNRLVSTFCVNPI